MATAANSELNSVSMVRPSECVYMRAHMRVHAATMNIIMQVQYILEKYKHRV